MVKVAIIVTRLSLCNSAFLGRRPRYRLPSTGSGQAFPQSTVTQNLFNHLWLTFLDKTNDLHRARTCRTSQRIKYLKIERHPFPEPLIHSFRKPQIKAQTRTIEHLPFLRDFYHPRHGKGTLQDLWLHHK